MPELIVRAESVASLARFARAAAAAAVSVFLEHPEILSPNPRVKMSIAIFVSFKLNISF